MAKNKRRSFLGYLWRIIVAMFVTSLLYVVICKWIMPPITITQTVSLFEGYGLHRDYVSWDEISPNVKLAAIASEDQLFPTHNGFDWNAIEKSVNSSGKKHVRGGAASTISQQAAKNVFLWQGSGVSRYIRKVPEFYFTKLIELIWGKKRILEVYLNVIETGPGTFGIEAAAQKYFHKPARNLSRAEAAMIIASLPNPKRFIVKPASGWVRWRYPHILDQMDNLDGDPDVHALIYSK